ncbi:hypothetical protein BY996DRAFT_6461115 [Phakopsora pachyrhizi]|nr:hypothetical protein BY996DRAFT_6461115 [Phakopsora pachyrhizi]
MFATTTDRGAARMTKIETAKLEGLSDNANGKDLKPNPERKGHDLKADEIAKERPNLAMEKTFLATPIKAVRSFKYQQPRVALDELKIGYLVSRSNSTNLREDKAKVKQTMEMRGMNFCGMQDRNKLKSEISMTLHTTATTSSLVPRGNETGRNKYQASMVDGHGDPSIITIKSKGAPRTRSFGDSPDLENFGDPRIPDGKLKQGKEGKVEEKNGRDRVFTYKTQSGILGTGIE